MNKIVLILGVIILAFLVYSQAVTKEYIVNCNMKTHITKPDDCTSQNKDSGYDCCYEYMRIITLNTQVCKYLEKSALGLENEFDLLRNTYNAKNVSIVCSSEALVLSLTFVLIIMLL